MTLTIFVNQKNAGLRSLLSNPHKYYKIQKRETGLEPAASTLARHFYTYILIYIVLKNGLNTMFFIIL